MASLVLSDDAALEAQKTWFSLEGPGTKVSVYRSETIATEALIATAMCLTRDNLQELCCLRIREEDLEASNIKFADPKKNGTTRIDQVDVWHEDLEGSVEDFKGLVRNLHQRIIADEEVIRVMKKELLKVQILKLLRDSPPSDGTLLAKCQKFVT